MVTKAQSAAAKAETPDAVKAAAVKGPKAPRVHKVAAGAVEGPKGKNMPDATNTPEVPEEQRQGERRQQQTNAIAQFTASQMTTPAAHEIPQAIDDAIKMKMFQEAMQSMATSMGIDPAVVLAPITQGKPAKAPRADKQVQNNVTRPAAGTKTGQIWDFADKLSAEAGGNPCTIAALRALKELKETNEHTLKTQHARWRAYHGIKGRATAQPAQAIPEGRDEGIENAFNRRKDDPKPE